MWAGTSRQCVSMAIRSVERRNVVASHITVSLVRLAAAVKLSPEVLAAYATMADAVETVLSRSAFGIVKLAKLFPQLAVDEQPPSKELSE